MKTFITVCLLLFLSSNGNAQLTSIATSGKPPFIIDYATLSESPQGDLGMPTTN